MPTGMAQLDVFFLHCYHIVFILHSLMFIPIQQSKLRFLKISRILFYRYKERPIRMESGFLPSRMGFIRSHKKRDNKKDESNSERSTMEMQSKS